MLATYGHGLKVIAFEELIDKFTQKVDASGGQKIVRNFLKAIKAGTSRRTSRYDKIFVGGKNMKKTNGIWRILAVLAAGAILASAWVRTPAAGAKDNEAQIEKILKQMTLEEKVAMCHANGLFTVAPVARLDIPVMWMSDGPRGVREEQKPLWFGNANWTTDTATAMPCGSAMAATWDLAAARTYGTILGAEARDRKKDIILGPSLNIQRVPLCGRNFEYLSEDPFLVGRLAATEIPAIQAQDTAACAKHFACNNQELDRGGVNETVSERALREIYLPGFESAVKEGGTLAVMAAYNKVNGQSCAENKQLIGILKQDWGFKGVLMTDWGCRFDTVSGALNGLDLEMGTGQNFEQYHLAKALLDAVKAGKVPEAVVDDKVRRHLRVLFGVHAMGGGERQPGSRNTAEHQAGARAIATESIVLLKNDAGLLPLPAAGLRKLVVIGANAVTTHSRGGGSAAMKPLYEVSPLAGLKAKLGDKVEVSYYPGYSAARGGRGGRGGRGARRGGAPGLGGVNPNMPQAANAQTSQAQQMRAEAVAAAKGADAVLFVGGLTADFDQEGNDRSDMKLPYGQDALIAELLAANPKTTVVLIGGSPVEMPWAGKAGTILWSYYGGQEAGKALADVLTGADSPSGHLPTTFPKKLEDSPSSQPGAYARGADEYKEGIFVGYRWFDAKKIEPLFPFGHGLSYTTFELSGLKAVKDGAGAKVSVDVKNTGKVAGAEVVQIYVGQPKCAVERPVRELKGFARVELKPGESKTVEVALDKRAFEYWSESDHNWKLEPGEFVIEAGVSSRDIRAKQGLGM